MFFSSLMHVAPHPSSHAPYRDRNLHSSRLHRPPVGLTAVSEIFVIMFIDISAVAGYIKFFIFAAELDKSMVTVVVNGGDDDIGYHHNNKKSYDAAPSNQRGIHCNSC